MRLDLESVLSPPGFVLIAIATDVAIVAVAFVLLQRGSDRIRLAVPKRMLPAVLVGCVAMGVVNGLGSLAISRSGEIYTGFPEVTLDAWGLVVLVVAGLVAPVAEELFFREAILVRVFRDTPRGVAIVLSSAVFGLLHLSAGGPILILTLFLMGVVLGELRLRTGSLGPPIVVHAVNNLAAVLLTVVE
jgi:membrane protease YdiL (CAAX protease family)